MTSENNDTIQGVPQLKQDIILKVEDILRTDEHGVEDCDCEYALAALLVKGELLVYGDDNGVQLEVICSDLFAWACADSEKFSYDDIPTLHKASLTAWGITKWCCRKRNQKPQLPVEKAMREAGVWDEEMEALPANTMDAEVQATFAAIVGATN
jgi:hypothetical protein